MYFASRHQPYTARFLSVILAFFLLASLCLTPITGAFAEPTSAEKQAEADIAQAKLAEAEDRAFAATEAYYAALDAHDEAIAAMDESQTRIDEAAAMINAKQLTLGARVNSMYRSGQTSYLDVLLGASTFSEFIATWDLINTINNQDANLISSIEKLKAEEQQAYDEYTLQETIAADKLVEAEAAKATLDEEAAGLRAQYDALTAEVAALIAAEEEARIAAEQAAAQAAAEAAANSGGGGSSGGGGGGGGGYFQGGSGPYSGVVDAALSRVGAEYAWGATGPNAFDCSGLVYWAFKQVGAYCPARSSESMLAAASGRYPVSEAQPGDVLYRYGHVGISLGGDDYVHASTYGVGVIVSHNASSQFTYVLRF
jgi:cell wall-associated NlpC family hydrolase